MIEIVGKVGSMALIDKKNGVLCEKKFSRICSGLRAGMVWVSSGAVEIGRLDYIKRFNKELSGTEEENKTDYASLGQAILIGKYRKYVKDFAIGQVLVEHTHFNDKKKREHLRGLLLRAAAQNTIPIINYNDAVSAEESRKMEINSLKCSESDAVYELVDNDETASQIALLVNARILLILSTLDGIYEDIKDKNSLIRSISGTGSEVIKRIDDIRKKCAGASRKGAAGAFAKLEYIKAPLLKGTKVIIASSKYDIKDILSEAAPSTIISCL